MEDKEHFKGLAFLVPIRHSLRTNVWVWPLVFAIGGFLLGFFFAPVSTKGNNLDKMTTAFGILLAAGITLAASVFVFQPKRLHRLKPFLVIFFAICAVVAPLIGVLPALPDSLYEHLWGAPLVLGLAVAGTAGLFLTFLFGWFQAPSS